MSKRKEDDLDYPKFNKKIKSSAANEQQVADTNQGVTPTQQVQQVNSNNRPQHHDAGSNFSIGSNPHGYSNTQHHHQQPHYRGIGRGSGGYPNQELVSRNQTPPQQYQSSGGYYSQPRRNDRDYGSSSSSTSSSSYGESSARGVRRDSNSQSHHNDNYYQNERFNSASSSSHDNNNYHHDRNDRYNRSYDYDQRDDRTVSNRSTNSYPHSQQGGNSKYYNSQQGSSHRNDHYSDSRYHERKNDRRERRDDNQARSIVHCGKLTTNFYKFGLKPGITLHVASFSLTCDSSVEEWKLLTLDDKNWIDNSLKAYPAFRCFIFSKITKDRQQIEESNGWKSSIGGFPITEGSVIVSTSKIEENFTLIYTKMDKKLPIKVEIKHLTSSSGGFVNDTRLSQAFAVGFEILQNRIGMIRMGTSVVERNYSEFGDYTIRNGIIPSISFIKQGACLTLSFKQKISMRQTLLECVKKYGPEKSSELFKGMSIIFNNRSFIIKEIDFTQNPSSQFKQAGKDISYSEYHLLKNRLHVTDSKQPLVCVIFKMKNQKRVKNYLLPEFCYLTANSKLGFKIREMIQAEPIKKFKSVKAKHEYIESFVTKLRSKSDESGVMEISPNAIQADYTVLKRPTRNNVEMRDKWQIDHSDLREMMKIDHRKRWGIVGKQGLVDEFIHFAKQQLDTTSMKIVNYFSSDIPVKEWNNVDFVFVLFERESNEENYTNIKNYFNCKVGIPTQCIVMGGNWSVKVKSCMANLAAKNGKSIWSVDNPLAEVNISVCGVDIQRRGRNSKGSVSLSINSGLSKYVTVPFETLEPKEVTIIVVNKIKELLEKFRRANNNSNPNYLIVYYRGSDLSMYEIQEFSDQLGETTRNCFISTNSETNARFSIQQNRSFENPEIGTVVKSLGKEDSEEFYLNSCKVSSFMGQSKPVRYEITLKSMDFYGKFKEIDINFDSIIELTFLQTHLYYNFHGIVKMPACLLYAKKLTEARNETKCDISEKMSSLPYFI